MKPKSYSTMTGRFAFFVVVTLVFLLCVVNPSFAQYSAWHYSTNVDVSSGAIPRVDSPVELNVDFTKWLAEAGGSGKTLDLNSIRVVEYSDAERTVLVGEKPSQFDQGDGFNAVTNAVGEVIWLLDGNTPAGTTRYFKIYYDVTENGTKTAPTYTSNLSWNPSTRTIENPAYRAVYSSTKGGITVLENKLSGSTKTMWNVAESEWFLMGQWHTLNEEGSDWIDSFGGSASAANLVTAGPVRVKIVSTRNEGRVNWTIERKFYAGVRPVDYWTTSVTAEKNASAPGTGRVWLKRIGWSHDGAAVNRTLVPPTNFGGWTLYDNVFEYGADGGVGIASSGNFVMNSSETIFSPEDHRAAQAQFDCWGLSWRTKPYPIVYDYAFVVHNGTDEVTANSFMVTANNEYNTPVVAAVANTATLTGVITDISNSNPVHGAIVRVFSGSFSSTAYSSATGSYTITGIPAGTVTFSVKADHYTYHSEGFFVSAGINQQDVILMPAPVIDMRSNDLGGAAPWLLATDVLCGGIVNPPTDDYSAPGANETGFMAASVPGDWDNKQGITDNIYGWYRAHITVPSEWAGSNIRFRDWIFNDVDAAYFNGVSIGATGRFPDPTTDVRNTTPTAVVNWFATRDYWISAENINFGGDNVIAVRGFDELYSGGITDGEPKLEMAPPAASLKCVVTGPTGPVQGASIYIPWIGTLTTGADGSCTFPFLVGDVYKVTASAYGYKTKTVTADVPDTGAATLNITMETAAAVSGTVTCNGQPLHRCRVWYTGPIEGSVVTDAEGNYSFTALPGTYSIVFNAFNAVPQTLPLTVGTSPTTLNVDLAFGLTPVYDAFPGTSLDMSKWDFVNLEPREPGGTTVATVADGVLHLETSPGRGGIMSKTQFPVVCSHEVVFARPYVGRNQIMNLYGGTGAFGDFVEIANEGTAYGFPRMAIFGTLATWAGISWSPHPISAAIVRTGRYYDFYVNGQWCYSNESNGLTDQLSRVYLYGWEEPETETIAYFSALCAGTPVAPTPTTVGALRSAATGSAVSVATATVSASFPDAFWIEASDRSSGIKVLSTANPGVGHNVSLIGRVIHMDGEAILQAASVTDLGTTGTVPDPLGVINRVGAVLDVPGATAQGLKVIVFGRFTGVLTDPISEYPTGLFIDDGSNLPGDGTSKGILIKIDPNWILSGLLFPPSIDQFMVVTGVLTLDKSTGSAIPCVRPQDYTDVRY